MIGVILCGGLGTRLRDVLPDLPKAMAPIRGRPFLEYQIEWLARSQIRELVLCVGYRGEAIRDHFGDGARFGVKLIYSLETSPMGTAGCLKLAEPFIQEPALVLNGDTFLTIDPNAMYQFHSARHAMATLAVASVQDASDFGSVTMDEQQRIKGFHEKRAGAGLVSMGAYLLEPEALRYVVPERPASMEYDLLPALLRVGEPVYGYSFSGRFLDIGTPERYRDAQEGWS